MDLKAIVLQNLGTERRLTRETIAAMVDGDVAFKPTGEQMSFGAQALHLISAQEALYQAFHDGTWVWERGLTLDRYPTLPSILAAFDEMHSREMAYYGSLNPQDFGREIATSWGPPEPMLQMIMSFLAHEAHHRGQMVCYLRLKKMQPPKY